MWQSILVRSLILLLLLLLSVCPGLQAKPFTNVINLKLKNVFFIDEESSTTPVTNMENGLPLDGSTTENDVLTCAERLQGKPYCQDVPNYEQAAQLEKIPDDQFVKFKNFFNTDLIEPENVAQRISFAPVEEDFCSSRTRLIYPKMAQTKDAKWKIVVQHPQHRQGILVETCDNEDGQCYLVDLLPKAYHTRCKQYYVYRTMVVVVNGVLHQEMVRMPNACKCVWWIV